MQSIDKSVHFNHYFGIMSNDFQYLYMDELTRQIIKTEINANDIVRIKSVNFIAKKTLIGSN